MGQAVDTAAGQAGLVAIRQDSGRSPPRGGPHHRMWWGVETEPQQPRTVARIAGGWWLTCARTVRRRHSGWGGWTGPGSRPWTAMLGQQLATWTLIPKRRKGLRVGEQWKPIPGARDERFHQGTGLPDLLHALAEERVLGHC